MSEIGIAVGTFLLVVLIEVARRVLRRRARSASSRTSRGTVTLQAMTSRVSELAPSLRETARVTAPQSPTDAGHVWASPNGRRVYIN